jgi:hypothetical protein
VARTSSSNGPITFDNKLRADFNEALDACAGKKHGRSFTAQTSMSVFAIQQQFSLL